MGNYSVPQEIRAMKPKGTMVKRIHNKFYVYEYFNRKDENGKWKTVMGKNIGYIHPEDGFIPNDTFIFNEESTTLEYGQYALAVNASKDTLNKLLTIFNKRDAYTIYILCIIHFVNGFTYLKDVHHYYEQSYLSLLFKDYSLSYHTLSKLLDSLGRKQTKVFEFQQLLLEQSSGQIAIDGHVLSCCSHNNDLAEFGNKYQTIQDMQINVLMAYDINTNQPLLSRVFEGGSLDKVSIKDVFEWYKFKNALLLMDKGFYSKENIDTIINQNNQYIIPLSHNLLAYKEITKELDFKKMFVYEKNKKRSIIEYKEMVIEDQHIFMYRDTNQNELEKMDYTKNMLKQPLKYTEEKFYEVKEYFGLFVLATNTNKTAEEVYALYKQRWKIETYFNYLKNKLNYQAINLEDYYKTQGLAFIMLVVSLIHQEMQIVVKQIKSRTIDDCLLESRFLKLHKQNNKWGPTNVKKGLQELARAFHVDLKEFM